MLGRDAYDNAYDIDIFHQNYEDTKPDYSFLCQTIGASFAGKTTLLETYAYGNFLPATPSIDNGACIDRYIKVDNDKIAKIDIYEESHEYRNRRHKKGSRHKYGGTDVFLLVFDLTNQRSFDYIKRCYDRAYEGSWRAKFILVGTKSDLVEERAVKYALAKKFAASYGMPYFETSAKNNTNLDLLFKALFREIENLTKPILTRASHYIGSFFCSFADESLPGASETRSSSSLSKTNKSTSSKSTKTKPSASKARSSNSIFALPNSAEDKDVVTPSAPSLSSMYSSNFIFGAPTPQVSSAKNEEPQEFICHITLGIMKDPVMLAEGEGHSYERKAIEEWLVNHNTDPMTRKVLSSKQLIPNIALKNAIEKYQEKNKVYSPGLR